MDESRKKQKLPVWREILITVANTTAERKRIAAVLDISPVTIGRWTKTNENMKQPRIEKLRLLPDALPQYREELTTSLKEEYPHIFAEPQATNANLEIPSEFYSHFISAFTTGLPLQRTETAFREILQQLLLQLDLAGHEISVFIAQFVPPPPGRKVRSLRTVTGRGNTPMAATFEHQTLYFGTESQVGVAATMTHQVIIQNQDMKQRMFPLQESSGSTAALPIVQYNCIAGCLCISCEQEEFFTPERLNLIQRYVNLLSVCINQEDFYNLEEIELRVMPTMVVQRPILKTIQQRIKHHMLQAMRENSSLTTRQAERKVFQEVEGELLQKAMIADG